MAKAAKFDQNRYLAPASQVETLANGGTLLETPPLPASQMNSAPRAAAPQSSYAAPLPQGPGPGPYGAPLTREQIAANSQAQGAQQKFITAAGSAAAGSALMDVKKTPEYQASAARLDEIRRKFGSNRTAMFADPDYISETQKIGAILKPVDQTRGQVTSGIQTAFAQNASGYNGARLANEGVPLTLEQMRQQNKLIGAQAGAVDATANMNNAQAGKTTEEASQVGQNAASARGVQSSEATLNTAKATNLPAETAAQTAGNQATQKAQGEALTYKQKADAAEQRLKDLESQLQAMRSYMEKNAEGFVDVSKVSSDNGGQGPTTQPSTTVAQGGAAPPTGQAFNGSRSPLATNAGGQAVPATQRTQDQPSTQPSDQEFDPQQVKQLGMKGQLPQTFKTGGKRYKLTGEVDSRGVPTAVPID